MGKFLILQRPREFIPASIPGLTMFFPDDLALSDNDPIAAWSPRFGATAGAITAAGAARPTYKTGILGSRPVALFDGAANILSSAVAASDNFTIFLVKKALTLTDTNERFMGLGAFGSIFNNGPNGTYNDQHKLGWYSNAAFGVVDGGIDTYPWSCVMATYAKGGNVNIYSDNILLATAAAPDNPSTETAFTVGGVGTDFINAYVAPFGYANSVLSDLHRNNLSTWIKNYMAHTYVVFDGDSQLDIDSSATATKAITSLGTGYSGSYFAISGQTMDTVNGAKAAITGVYSAYRRKNVCVVWAGTNDIVGDTSSADIIADISAYCTAVQAVGYKVVVVNILARGGLTVPQETVRGEVNASLAANYTSYANALVDVTADARLQDPEDTDYFNVDQTHLVDAGQTIVAALITTAVQSV